MARVPPDRIESSSGRDIAKGKITHSGPQARQNRLILLKQYNRKADVCCYRAGCVADGRGGVMHFRTGMVEDDDMRMWKATLAGLLIVTSMTPRLEAQLGLPAAASPFSPLPGAAASPLGAAPAAV